MIYKHIRNPFPPGASIAAYLRDSGGENQELSLPQQEAAIRQWAAEQNLVLTRIFRDEARQGSSTINRTDFQAMMHHFRSAKVEEAGLVIWSYTRFSRDIDDSQFFRADLRRRGFILHSLNDEIPEGPMGRLFEAAIDWKNEQFLLDLSADVKRGLYNLVLNHGAVPGIPPRGFKTEPVDLGVRRDGRRHIVHRWVPDPDTWELCAAAWKMRAGGLSLKLINDELHLFSSLNSYPTFFKNRLYMGELRFGDLVVPNYAPAMVDEATWLLVQAVNKKRGPGSLKGNNGDNPYHSRRVHSVYPAQRTGLLRHLRRAP